MPKYELMYIVGSNVSDDEIPKLNDELRTFIQKEGGLIEKFEDLGKKKLAYPIKKIKTGDYIVINFSAPSDKIAGIEHRVRTSQPIIRHLVVNMDDGLLQMEKDRLTQSRLKPRLLKEEEKVDQAPAKPLIGKGEKKIEIDLDAEIEKALDNENLK